MTKASVAALKGTGRLVWAFFGAPGNVLGLLALIATVVTLIKSPVAGALILAGSIVLFGAVPFYAFVLGQRNRPAYEITLASATWQILADDGSTAHFTKVSTIRANQRDVNVVSHTVSADGTVAGYGGSPGRVMYDFSVGTNYHYYVHSLQRNLTQNTDEEVTFTADLRDAFMGQRESVSVALTRPTKSLKMVVIFPKNRPCSSAWLLRNKSTMRIPLVPVGLANGCQQVEVAQARTSVNQTYEIEWDW